MKRWWRRLWAWVPRRRHVLYTATALGAGRYSLTVANVDGEIIYWKVVSDAEHPKPEA